MIIWYEGVISEYTVASDRLFTVMQRVLQCDVQIYVSVGQCIGQCDFSIVCMGCYVIILLFPLVLIAPNLVSKGDKGDKSKWTLLCIASS